MGSEVDQSAGGRREAAEERRDSHEADPKNEGAKYSPLSSRGYAAPFGRFVGDAEVEPPSNEVLVGRIGQRAYLTDLLIAMGRRGSYLVTGRRGAGKTVFVRQCITEYRESVFKRYLRSNVGKGLWDRVAVILVWLVLLMGALALSELSQLLSHVAGAHGEKKVLVWALLVPFGILFLYPCVYAKEVFEAILLPGRLREGGELREGGRDSSEGGNSRRRREERSGKGGEGGRDQGVSASILKPRWIVGWIIGWVSGLRAEGLVATILVVGLFSSVWCCGPFGAPAVSLGRIFLVVGLLYLVISSCRSHRWSPNAALRTMNRKGTSAGRMPRRTAPKAG